MWHEKLFQDNTYALLLVETRDGERLYEPVAVGDGGIVEVVRRFSEQYPGCRARLFSRDHDRRYFGNYIPPERIF